MMDHTTIIVYGASDENKKKIAEEFDWGRILSGSEFFTRNKFNPNIYEQGNNYSIAAHGKSICVHPGDVSSVKRAIEDLIPVVSKHYHCRCHISGNYSHLTVIISMISDEECVSQGMKTGEIIEFGCWQQGANSEVLPIRWKVLHTDGRIALLIAEDCLIMSGYCDSQKGYGNKWYLMWGNSLAREMCNGFFYHRAFGDEEKNIIIPKEMSEPLNGPKCSDEVFLLSEGEVILFMGSKENRKAKPSLSLQSRKTEHGAGVFLQSEGYTSWWVLPEEDEVSGIYPKAVWPNGEIQFHGRNGYHGDFTIRPCIQIDLERYRKYQEKQKKNRDTIPQNVSVKTKTSGMPQKGLASFLKKGTVSHPKISGGQAYSLAYIQGYYGAKRENRPGARTARYDEALGKWRLTIQLDEAGVWFLSVFVRNDGTFEKYSLDQETASDSHYEFRNEKELRRAIYCPDDETKYLAEVLIRYVHLHGGHGLAAVLKPFITAEYHFDEY